MIFPNDVHKRAANAHKLLAQDKNSIIMQIFIIANIICFFIFRFIFNTFLSLSTGWAILAQIVLFFVIGVMLFRFVIFKEDEKLQDYKDQQSDSFARYLHIRKDNIDITKINNESVSVLEYTNGSVMSTILFKFGSNDDNLARSTKEVLQAIYGVISSYNFEFRTVSLPEVFSNSKEYNKHLEQINCIKNKKLSYFLKRISEQSLTIANTSSSTNVLYLMIRSKIPGEKEQLICIIKEILKILLENVTCFRSIEFLNKDSLLEFFREFYGIEAIDLAMMKAIELSSDIENDYKKLITLYSLQSTDNKSYRVVNERDNQFVTKEREL